MKKQSFWVGDVEIKCPVLLAPMSGVTDQPFRKMVRKFGPELVFSEMIASKEMLYSEPNKVRKVSSNCAAEYPMAVQLAGWDPNDMALAAQMNEARGAAIIDINMGCPAKKVINKDAGSALMKDLVLARNIIKSVVKSVTIPVTLKMRTGWDDKNRNAPELARIAECEGVKMLTVHGRTRSQFYKGRADWAIISEVKQKVAIPVVANGDIKSEYDAKNCLKESGADGVMVGRGVYGRPWFLSRITNFLKTGTVLANPDMEKEKVMLMEHLELMLTHYGFDDGTRLARKHIAWYTKGIPSSAIFRQRIYSANTLNSLVAEINALYDYASHQMVTE